MLKRMTIRAKHLKVFKFVVVPVAVFMVNAKDALLGVITAAPAGLQKPAPKHRLTDCGESGFPLGLVGLVDAGATAIFPVLGRACAKFLFAVTAFYGNAALEVHRLVVARARAVFCLLGARGNVGELVAACFAIGGRLYSLGKRLAGKGTIFSGFGAVLGNAKNCATMAASYFHGVCRAS